MSTFEPIAIVGRACLLPGAATPEELWQAVVAGRDLLGSAPPDRWGLSQQNALGTPDNHADKAWSDRGGYVRGFEFDPSGYALPERHLSALDPLFQWAMHVAREAIRDAGGVDAAKTGLVLGNLSFPSTSMSRFAERTWLGDDLADAAGIPKSDPHNRFMSGLPAHLTAQALGLGGEAFCLDAACASSLYAIKLACDQLHDRKADVMLAGAVNRADDLFIHVGFCALKALSQTGQSRPFHAEADGLVPAEGAAVVTLKRLSDAVAAGDTIHGVIRGVGLSNDGRDQGLLVPSSAGQVRAMRAAYERSGLTPSDISLIECHATGTVVGDRIELKSMSDVWTGCAEVPVGSLKSNMGHLITTAGAAGLIKVLSAIEHQTRPPSLHVEAENPALAGSPLRVLKTAEPWTGRRRAGISAFGFGGNNAHLVVEEYVAGEAPEVASEAPKGPVAIVALSLTKNPETIEIPVAGLKFPPRDLERSLPQQLAILADAFRAVPELDLPRDRTGVLVGMGCDPNVARYGARWRMADWAAEWGNQDNLAAMRDGFTPLLESPGVLGTMPNIPANRLNSQFDLAGASLTVSSEELSGVRALEIAARALRAGDLDAAVVGAVDMSREPVQQAAIAALAPGRKTEDASVVLVLERLSDAQAKRHPVIAILDDVSGQAIESAHCGAHAAAGLVQIAEAASQTSEGDTVALALSALGGQTAQLALVGGPAEPKAATAPARALKFAGHWPEITPPAMKAPQTVGLAPLQPSPGVQTMPTAPELPPIVAPDVAPAPQPAPAVTPPPAPAAAGFHMELAAYHAQLSHVHQQFVAQQGHVHKQFLELRARTNAGLLDAYQRSSGGIIPAAPVAVPTPPIPVPAPPVVAKAPPVVAEAPAPTPKPVPAAPEPVVATLKKPTGLTLDREGLKTHASGRISEIYGDLFKQQDGYERQVRMPEPPLLLADRMTGLDAVAGSMGKGTIWTETDVTQESWWLHDGRMPAGIMIESGQADLMLISYLGIDFTNKSDRVYRLLGCELTYHRGLPTVGDTLKYDIHVDGHARQGDIRLFFFHYDCRIGDDIRLSVREGQAGFFTEEELLDSAGVLWSPEDGEHTDNPRMDPPAVECTKTSLTAKELQAFSEGRAYDCFGPGFETACAHTRTARISGGRMLFMDRVTHLERDGGAWGRGYLRAVDEIEPDDWFFDGHFKSDPCMPGTLMFEGCLQAMAVYMTSLGYTIDRDGWRFEPVADIPYQLRCRGEVDPDSKELIYEVFIEEIIDGPEPTIYADLLCTVDGLKAFHCRRMGLRLVPSWPMDSRPDLLDEYVETKPVHVAKDGFVFDYASLLACAWGKPSLAFSEMYKPYDDGGRVPRLPGPPYHFMSRVTSVKPELDGPKPGAIIEIEYDVPEDVWYFRENGCETMPFCVLLEAALQPCGWLASGVGSIVGSDQALFFRNLDGTGTLTRELLPGCGTLTTRVKIKSVSNAGGMIIEGFDVECFLQDDPEPIYVMDTVFGFFPGAALANQIGLPITDDHRAHLEAPCDETVNLRIKDDRWFGGTARLPAPFQLMIDRVDGIWPDAGDAGLGRYRAVKDIDPDEWFFKAHFHQDPVQPGSLGISAMIQLLQFAMLHKGMDQGVAEPRFEPLMLGAPLTWKYRGQVLPKNKLVHSTIEITEQGADERGPFAICKASLWVDGMRIYEASNLGMRITSGAVDTTLWNETLDPAQDTWLADHCPTWTVPALPMMSMLDRLAGAAAGEGRVINGAKNVAVKRWLPIGEPTIIRHDIHTDGRRSKVSLTNDDGAIAEGTVLVSNGYVMGPAPFKALQDDEAPNPYAAGTLFHGPAFQLLKSLRIGDTGASAILNAGAGAVPFGTLNQGLLDAATHAIPHDRLHLWSDEIPEDHVAYPAMIPQLSIHGPAPREGEVRCEVRFDGFFGGPRFPAFQVQLITGDKVWAAFRLVEALFPKGPLGRANPLDRRAFLRDRAFVDGLSLSDHDDGATRLTEARVAESDWLPGTIDGLYGARDVETIAAKEHVAREIGVHPGAVPAALPLNTFETVTTQDGDTTVVTSGAETLDIGVVRDFWTQWFDREPWPVEDLYYGLIQRFVRRVVLPDPAAFNAIHGKSALYLANHQTGVESLVFSILASGLAGVPTVTLAKAEHRHTWLGKLIAHCFTYPDVKDPQVIAFFDREDRESLPRIIGDLAMQMAGPGKSVMVHVEGTRSFDSSKPVEKMSGAFIDMALKVGVPVVPLRFTGGLPQSPLDKRIEFPIGMGTQDLWIGRPLMPDELSSMPYGDRKKKVIAAINALGPSNADETANPPDPEFAAKVAEHVAKYGVTEEHAVLALVLAEQQGCPESHRILARESFPDDPTGRWLTELRTRLFG